MPENTLPNLQAKVKYNMDQLAETQTKINRISERLTEVRESEIKIEESLKYLTIGVEDIKKQLIDFKKTTGKRFVTQEQFRPYKVILGVIGTAAVLNYVNDILNLI